MPGANGGEKLDLVLVAWFLANGWSRLGWNRSGWLGSLFHSPSGDGDGRSRGDANVSLRGKQREAREGQNANEKSRREGEKKEGQGRGLLRPLTRSSDWRLLVSYTRLQVTVPIFCYVLGMAHGPSRC